MLRVIGLVAILIALAALVWMLKWYILTGVGILTVFVAIFGDLKAETQRDQD